MANELISIERLENFHADITVDAHILKRSTAYAVDNIVNKGFVYLKCTQAGTTASTALSLSGVSVGDTLTDGGVKWEVISVNGPAGGGTGAGLEDWESNHNYAVDDIYVYEGEIYKTLVKFTSGVTEDSRTEINDVVPSVWTANTAYTAGDIIEHTDVTTLKKVYYDVTDDFTSGATFEVTAEMDELQITEEYVPNPLTKQQVKNLINNFVPSGSGTDPIFYNDSPIGTIIAYMGITAPKDYLACDGQTYNIVDYKELAEYIKRQFGSYDYFGGDGTTTFAVPDLRGEFLRGTGTNSHTSSSGIVQGSGANVGVHQDSTEIPQLYYDTNGNNFALLNQTTDGTATRIINEDSGKLGNGTLSYVSQDGIADILRNSHATIRPTNTSVLYCIKYNTSVLSTPENNYSTEEQRVGTWIDGKPLYQKTYSCTSPSTSEIDTDTIILDNIINVINIDGYLFANESVPINFYYSSTIYISTWQSFSSFNVRMRVSTNYTNKPCYITLKYTKTTD